MRERIAFVARDAEDLLRRSTPCWRGRMATCFAVLFRADGALTKRYSTPSAAIRSRSRVPGSAAPTSTGLGCMRARRVGASRSQSYPFQRKRYWLPLEAAPAAPASGLSPDPAGAGTFEIDLTGREFFLADHRIGGRPVLPGVAYLELVRAAAVKAGLTRPLLRQVVWMSPLAVESPVRVRVVFTQAADGARRAEVLSVAAGEEPHLHAQMLVTDALVAPPAAVDLAALKLAHPRAIPAERVYAAFDAMASSMGRGTGRSPLLPLDPARMVSARFSPAFACRMR